MTISAAAASVATMPLTGIAPGAADPLASDGPSFAQALLDLLDQQLALPQGAERPFASGTMPSTVERFDAHGFFDGSAPLGPTCGPAVLPVSALMSAVPDPVDGKPPVAPSMPPVKSEEAPTITMAPELASTWPMDPSGLRSGATDSVGGDAAPSAPSAPTASIASGAAGTGMPVRVGPVGRPPVAVTVKSAVALSSRSRDVPRSEPGNANGAGLSVGMDISGDGVAVTVVSDHREVGDGETLHGAVAGLLARHGLVLSELRITRRGAAGDHSERGT